MMKPMISIVVALAMSIAAGAAWAAADKGTTAAQGKLRKQIEGHAGLTKNVKAFVVKNLLPATATPSWASAAEAQNAKGMTLAQIQETDKKWAGAESELPIMKELMSSDCAKDVAALAKKFPAILEAFVTDNQGANVCQNALTSDYWQGDEAKWKNSFNGGKGGVDAGKVAFDKSANANLQQVSLPIFGMGGKIIGAVTFGLSVDGM